MSLAEWPWGQVLLKQVPLLKNLGLKPGSEIFLLQKENLARPGKFQSLWVLVKITIPLSRLRKKIPRISPTNGHSFGKVETTKRTKVSKKPNNKSLFSIEAMIYWISLRGSRLESLKPRDLNIMLVLLNGCQRYWFTELLIYTFIFVHRSINRSEVDGKNFYRT